ncbi:MAG TPA: ATP-dependent DNA helicase [Natronosporangium sp.]|nr:ATP-dependent DNA helicase [Natronosporangium sp.]
MRRPAAPPVVELDEAQRSVVAHTSGPLLVVGGPGTGKTTTLVEAVAARVAEGADPQRVLVLTFGRRAAGRLRERIEARIADRAVAQPLVRTFHAYAYGLLRRAATARGEPAPRLLTGPEQDALIRELLAGAPHRWPDRLRAALPTRAFAAQLRDLLLRAAERGIDADQLDALGAKYGRDDWRAAAAFKVEYDAVLALRDATGGGTVGYDHAELVRAAAATVRDDPDLLAAERRRLQAVYVDEYADTDPAQRELLALVAGGGAPLVVFADPDSSTYAFRGGDPEGVREFPDRFPTPAGHPAPTLTLRRSYRSGGRLLAAAARVGRRLRGPARHRALTPAEDLPPGRVEVRLFRSAVSEHAWLAYRLRGLHLHEGVSWSRMAVLVRAGNQLPRVQRALRAAGVPTVVHGEDLPLPAQPAVAPLLQLLRAALEPDRLDEEAAVALLHSPLGGADPLAERRLRQGLRARALAAGDQRPSGRLLVEALRHPDELAAVDRSWAEPARRVAGLIATAREAAARPAATIEDVLWAVWQRSGLAERWSATATRPGEDPARAEAADRNLDAVMVLFDAAARYTDRLPGAGPLGFLDYVLDQQLPADTLAPTGDRGEAVRLLTAHAAKGLEWDVVALPGVQEGVWPDLRLRGSLLGAEQLVDIAAGREVGPVGQTSALLDEERRLFHVAVTRARRHLLASAVAADSVGGVAQAEEPSRFLRELVGRDPDPPAEGPAAEGPVTTDGELVAGAAAGPDGDPVAGAAADGELAAQGLAGLDGGPATGAGVRALTLPALVAELRAATADPAAPPARRRAAAAQLARLAAAGVRGAHPDQWWGLAPLSDDRPLADPGQPVRVSPSTIESTLRCSLRWLLERHGGAAPATAAQGVGNLVHAAAMLADRVGHDRQALLEWMSARFDEIEHAAVWLAGRERQRAEEMVDKLLRWVAANPRRLLEVEREFVVRLDGPPPVELRGRVDRLERDGSGRLVVVDLKTGRSAPTAGDIATHAQLGAYQVAVEAGAFGEHGTESGGAALVQLGTSGQDAREQVQPPLSEVDDPGWARELVRRAGAVLAGATFEARRNDRCRTCPVRTSCPVSGQGRQVVQP